jgi:hypothetical protein
MTEDRRGNGGTTLDLNGVFTMGDLVMMIDLFQYGVGRSMMCEGRDASKRMEEIVEQLKALSPLPKGKCSLGHEWYRACKAASSATYYGAYMVEIPRSYRGSDFHMDVVCDGEVHRVVQEGVREDIEASLLAVRQCLRDLAPVSAEPVTILKGLVDLDQEIDIRRREDQDWQNKGRLDEIQVAMSDRLLPTTPYAHVIEAKNFWAIKSVVETRFAVPVSVAEAVVAHVADLNHGALTEYSKKWRSEPFVVTPSP